MVETPMVMPTLEDVLIVSNRLQKIMRSRIVSGITQMLAQLEYILETPEQGIVVVLNFRSASRLDEGG